MVPPNYMYFASTKSHVVSDAIAGLFAVRVLFHQTPAFHQIGASSQLWPAQPNRDSSLCCNCRLKALVCQFINRNREFEFSSLRQAVLCFRVLCRKLENSAHVLGVCST